MFEDFAFAGGAVIKYGIILFFIVFTFAVISRVVARLREEPGTFAKLLLVTIAPPALALTIPYFIMHKQLGTPLWLNVIAGFAIYALSHGFLDKHIDARFKDEKSH